jgi:hypothetical protein
MQTQVASLLLIVSSVAFASIVVGFAAVVMQQSLDIHSNPQIEKIQSIQNDMLNQTNTWLDGLQNELSNQTITDTGP